MLTDFNQEWWHTKIRVCQTKFEPKNKNKKKTHHFCGADSASFVLGYYAVSVVFFVKVFSEDIFCMSFVTQNGEEENNTERTKDRVGWKGGKTRQIGVAPGRTSPDGNRTHNLLYDRQMCYELCYRGGRW